VAVLLDGPGWAKRLTVRDRDALPAEVLVGALGWPRVERVWLPDWLADQDAVAARLVTAVAEAALPSDRPFAPPVGPPPVAATPSPAPPPRAERAPVAAAEPGEMLLRGLAVAAPAPSPSSQDFRPWSPRRFGPVGVLDDLPAPHARREVAAALTEVVDAEGPVTLDRLAKLVANGFGLNRVAESRKSAILECLPRAVRRDRAEPVAWPAGLEPTEWQGYRATPEGVERPIEQVPLREIGNAMVVLAGATAGMGRTELQREALRVFGLRRLTTATAERLDEALSLTLRGGRLVMVGELIVPGTDG
jgi:hypothetical protein